MTYLLNIHSELTWRLVFTEHVFYFDFEGWLYGSEHSSCCIPPDMLAECLVIHSYHISEHIPLSLSTLQRSPVLF